MYAIFDERHQGLTPNRTPYAGDVVLGNRSLDSDFWYFDSKQVTKLDVQTYCIIRMVKGVESFDGARSVSVYITKNARSN